MSCAHKTIHLWWIPSHIGIRGNEAADMAANESLDQDITVSQVPCTDLKSHINRFISSKWQERWSSYRDKFFQIKPTLGEWPSGFRNLVKRKLFRRGSEFAIRTFPTHIYFTSGRSSWMHSMSGDLLCQARFDKHFILSQPWEHYLIL